MKPSDKDLFGTIHLTDGTGARFDSYYSTMEAIRPLLESPQWQSNTTGWYLNASRGNFDTVRISYFCPGDGDPRKTVDAFLADNSLSLVAVPESPRDTKVANSYGGEESRFRSYLSTYSSIGLDLLNADRHYAQCLFVTYRWQVFMSRGDCRAHFVPSFASRSPYYRTMSVARQEQFWADFAHWPNPPQVDWAHMFVNMILGCDWNHVFRWTYPRPALSNEEVNGILRDEHVFQVPNEWKPDRP